MPSQRPVIIPGNAVLDDDVCADYGRPLFAWHPNSGRIGVNGGGIAVSRGSVRNVAAAIPSGLKIAAGGLSANGSSYISFGTVAALNIYSMSAFCQFSTTASTGGTIGGTFNSTDTSGWSFQASQGTNSVFSKIPGGGLVTPSIAIPSGVILSAFMYMNALSAGAGCLVVTNAAAKTATATVGSTTYGAGPNYMYLFARNSGGNTPVQPTTNLYQFLVWGRPNAFRLGYELDENPTLFWWWPGKSKRVFSIASLITAIFAASGAGTVTLTPQQMAALAPDGAGALTASAQQLATLSPAGAGAVTLTPQQIALANWAGAGTITLLGQYVGGSNIAIYGAGLFTATPQVIATLGPAGAGTLTTAPQIAATMAPAGAGKLTAFAQNIVSLAAYGQGVLTAFGQNGSSTPVSGSVFFTGGGVFSARAYMSRPGVVFGGGVGGANDGCNPHGSSDGASSLGASDGNATQAGS